MRTNVYPKDHTWNTVNILEKESKHTIKILVINIALYMEVSYGEGDKGRRIGQGKCCQAIGLENEKLSLVCGGPWLLSFHLKKNYFTVVNIQSSQWLVKETSFASLDNHPSLFLTKETSSVLSIVQRKTYFISIYVQRTSCTIFWCLNLWPVVIIAIIILMN